jgi:hypothetical protein
MSDESELSLLNIYEVETDEGTKHLVGFQDPVLAGSVGLASHAMIGEFRPDPDGEFDPDSFTVNPEFVEAVTQYMNAVPVEAPALVEGARQIPGERLYVVDPRNDTPMDEDPPAEDVLGWYEVDDAGQVVPDSFEYNGEHLWFSTRSGVSGLLEDRNFYRFLHPEAHGEDEEGGADAE